MARSGDLGKGETSSKRPGSMENSFKSERAEKKPRLSKTNSTSSRKRAWSQVADTDVNSKEFEDPSTSRKTICVGSTKKNNGEGDKLADYRVTRESKDSELNIEGTGSKLDEIRYVEKPQISQRRWKRIPKSANFGGFGDDDGSSARSSTVEGEERGMHIREHEVVRKVLQTVYLEENCIAGQKETVADHEEDSIGFQKDSKGIASSLKQSGRDKKRRGPDKADVSPPKRPEKKSRIDVALTKASSRGTWKRLKGPKPKRSAAASEDMGVSVSEAWKRLREEKDTGTSGSLVNGRSDSDLSMHSSNSELEILEERTKKARHDLPLPAQGKQQTRKNSEKKESSSSKRLREGSGCKSSGSSGSDVSHSSYFHSRKWKRPRFEYMMSMHGRSWRKQAQDIGEARVGFRESATRKRVQDDTSEKPTKRQRK